MTVGITTTGTLAGELAGSLYRAGTPEYDDEIAGFNTSITHAPELVVVPTGPADVQVAMRYAAAHGMPIGVQATGHGANHPISSGILVSTRRLDTLAVDPVTATATIGAGVRWREVLAAAAEYGLAPLVGSTSDVSAVGYTLGGGLPVACRTFGYAADRVRSFDVVTPDGALRHVDAASEPELSWGLRGGVGNLGIVTQMTIELERLRTVYGGGIFYAAEHIPAVLRAYQQWTAAGLPDALSSSVAILNLPPLPDVPEPLRGKTLAHLRVCYVGKAAAGERLVAPMREAAPAMIEDISDMPYAALDSIHRDPTSPAPFRTRGTLLGEFTPETADALAAATTSKANSPLIATELRQMGGALATGPAERSAMGGRNAAFSLTVIGLAPPGMDRAALAAIDTVIDAVEPWSTGHTLPNFHGHFGDEADRARAWEPEAYQRLVGLTRVLDPHRLLRHGHAIGRT